MGSILFLYYEESLVSSYLNSKLLWFHSVRPIVYVWKGFGTRCFLFPISNCITTRSSKEYIHITTYFTYTLKVCSVSSTGYVCKLYVCI